MVRICTYASILLVVLVAIPEIRSDFTDTNVFRSILSLQHNLEGNKENHEPRLVRQKRQISAGGNCNSWTSWMNHHTPTTTDKNDYDSISSSTLNTVCPSILGGNITKMECVDDKGEPFAGIREDRLHRFTINCADPKIGMVCTVKDTSWDKQCPDLSVRYFCACPNSTVLSTKEPLTTRQTSWITKPPLFTIQTPMSKKQTSVIYKLSRDHSSVDPNQVSSSTTLKSSTLRQFTSSGTFSASRYRTLSSQFDNTSKHTTDVSLGNVLQYEGDGFTETDSKIIFYSSIVMGSGLLLLTMMSCITLCIVCNRKVESEEEENGRNRRAQVRPLASV